MKAVVPPLVAMALSLPLVVFSVLEYEINPAFVLAPLVAFALFSELPNRYSMAFCAAGLGGVTSVLVAHYIDPSNVVRSFFGLTLALIAPSFLFLGRWMRHRGLRVRDLCFWFALFSAVFVVPVVVRLLLNGEPVRAYIGWQGFAVLNAYWFGLPVFASFGVLSLAYLFCLQMFILAAALYRRNATWITLLVFAGLTGSVFMVMGSDSRFAQLCILWLAATAAAAAFFRGQALRSLLVLLAIAIGVGGTLMRVPTTELRIYKSASVILQGDEAPPEKVDITTGRVDLIKAGLEELIASPVIGNGFSGYGRFSTKERSDFQSANSSTHVYYLTIFWKGGIVFGLPLAALLAMVALDGIRNRPWRTAQGFYLVSAVALAFGPMALTWDILYVPSAGALAWLLLGFVSFRPRYSLRPRALDRPGSSAPQPAPTES
ncbi:hypothetical protein ACQKKX_12385 [Neorhizobium sp. NPDC001467]|uniref:hypothetical protein n=1 Tax=Neorhizobium sp. NPDC001467 TaxID=3390595 RepID=UPI003D05B2F0